jgi:hypothetical protein
LARIANRATAAETDIAATRKMKVIPRFCGELRVSEVMMWKGRRISRMSVVMVKTMLIMFVRVEVMGEQSVPV